MAAYLPYCDVYGADRFMAELARSLKVPERYNCHLFDSRKDGVAKLIDHLNNALGGIAPVNVPGLSIFVAASDCTRSFFHKLGTQAKGQRTATASGLSCSALMTEGCLDTR